MSYFVSENSIIEQNVTLGDGTKVWYLAHVMEGARLGKDCVVGERTFIGRKVIIGDNCKIGNACELVEGVILKDNVRLGLGVRFTNVRKPSVKKAKKLLDTLVGEGVTIETGAVIQGGVNIGKGAIVGAGAVVISDVPDFSFVVGNPAKVVRKKLE